MVYHNPIVIGSGIIGSSVVYHLSRMKYAVKWFDPMPHGWFSTSRAAGLILHGSQKNAPISLFARQTIRDIHNLETQLNENIGFNQCGSLSFHKNKYPTTPITHWVGGGGGCGEVGTAQELGGWACRPGVGG